MQGVENAEPWGPFASGLTGETYTPVKNSRHGTTDAAHRHRRCLPPSDVAGHGAHRIARRCPALRASALVRRMLAATGGL